MDINHSVEDPILAGHLQKWERGKFTWDDARQFFHYQGASEQHWDQFFNAVYETHKKLGKRSPSLKFYIPGKAFPSISLTGDQCELNCEHCDRKYLHHMIPAPTQEDLQSVLTHLAHHQRVGALLSGGCDADGKVRFSQFSDTIRKFKGSPPGQEFYLNSHVGLLSSDEAAEIHDMGIDTVSFDLNLDPEVIARVFHLKRTPQDYKDSFEALLQNHVRAIPHILVGANFGRLNKELDALQYLSELKLHFERPYQPEIVVFIAMIPPRTKGVRDPRFDLVSAADVAKHFFIARSFFPNTELSLGCMRPQGAFSYKQEVWSVQAGANRIVKPSLKTRNWAERQAISTQDYEDCCLVPSKFQSS